VKERKNKKIIYYIVVKQCHASGILNIIRYTTVSFILAWTYYNI